MDTQISKDILQKVRRLEIRTRRMVDESLAGRYLSVFKGRGMHFDEVREYVPGDEIRAIDWNVTARTGRPFVKKFVEERELTILLLMDVSASGDFGSKEYTKREMMAEIASVLAFSAVKNNDRVGLVLFSDNVELYIPPAKGRRHILRLIREILFFSPQGRGTDLAAALDFAGRVVRRKAVAFLISDFCLMDDFEKTLEGLVPKLTAFSSRHDVVALSVNDPREHALPDIGILAIEDAETGEQVELDTSDPKIRESFARISEGRARDLGRAVRSAGADFLPLATDAPYMPALVGFFRARERRIRQ